MTIYDCWHPRTGSSRCPLAATALLARLQKRRRYAAANGCNMRFGTCIVRAGIKKDHRLAASSNGLGVIVAKATEVNYYI
jgi:hypothetical protein